MLGDIKKKQSKPVVFDTKTPWSHAPETLAKCWAAASPAERMAARASFSAAANYCLGLLDHMPLSVAKAMFGNGELALADSIWGSRAAQCYAGTGPVLPRRSRGGRSVENASLAVEADLSHLSLFQKVAVLGLAQKWVHGGSYVGSFEDNQRGRDALTLCQWELERDPTLAAEVDAAIDAVTPYFILRADREAVLQMPIGPTLKGLRAALGQLGVGAERVAAFEREMAPFLLGGTGAKDGVEEKALAAWKLAFRSALESDVSSVGLAIAEAALIQGFDLLAPEARWKSGRSMRTALGLACEVGALGFVKELARRNAPTGAVSVGDCFLGSANPLLSLADRYLESVCNENVLDKMAWREAFLSVFELMGREARQRGGPAGEDAAMRAMAVDVGLRPGVVQQMAARYAAPFMRVDVSIANAHVEQAAGMIESALLAQMMPVSATRPAARASRL